MKCRPFVNWLGAVAVVFLPLINSCTAGNKLPGRPQATIKLLAFFTAKNDAAHISFVNEANRWFPEAGRTNGFHYDTTSNWDNMREDVLAHYDLVLFLDTRPEKAEHRLAFEKYMRNGGAWIGFHFAGFALTPSAYPQNWNWYHDEFLGSGQYRSNTWRPVPATLRVEDSAHPAVIGLPAKFITAANEWYAWEKDLKANPDISILLSVDSSSFPLGTGPKQHEIWNSGYYPIAWTNKQYRMIYMNMGHNDMDYEGGTNKELSSQFSSEMQNQFILNSIAWLSGRAGKLTGRVMHTQPSD